VWYDRGSRAHVLSRLGSNNKPDGDDVEVEAHLFYWTPDGMRQSVAFPCQRSTTAYVEKAEVTRLLEEAHERGWRNAINAANSVVRNTKP
jgi:hypothetical protein